MLNFPAITTIVAALEAVLRTATWTPEGGTPELAFGEVERFQTLDIEAACRELAVVRQRACLVVATDENWESQAQDKKYGFAPQCKVQRQISLLITDRAMGDRQAALYGDATHAGGYPLSEIALHTVCGPMTVGGIAVFVAPVRRTPFAVAVDDRPGRVCVQVELECSTDWRPLIV